MCSHITRAHSLSAADSDYCHAQNDTDPNAETNCNSAANSISNSEAKTYRKAQTNPDSRCVAGH